MLKRQKEGFSLVELMIAIALSAILMLGLLSIMSYGSRSMRVTQARVSLQDAAKDVTNHISTYVQEGNTQVAYYDESSVKYLIVQKQNVSNITGQTPIGVTAAPTTSPAGVVTPIPAGATATPAPAQASIGYIAYIYWFINGNMYFADATVVDSAFKPAEFTSVSPADCVDQTKLTADKKYLLAENVKDFQCIVEPAVNKKKSSILKVQIEMEDKDGAATFDFEKEIMMRNQ